MAELDDYFSLIVDNDMTFRNMDRCPSATSKNSEERYRAYETQRRKEMVSEVLAELEADTSRADAIHKNLARMLDLLIETFSAEVEGVPVAENDDEVAYHTMKTLHIVSVLAILTGSETDNSVVPMGFGMMNKEAVTLVIETLKLARKELLDQPFRNKRDAIDFLSKYTFADGARDRGLDLVASAARLSGWE